MSNLSGKDIEMLNLNNPKIADVIKNVYAIEDLKSNAFGPLMQFSRDGEATRMLDLMVNDKQESLLTRYPEDHRLFCIGTFNVTKGLIYGETPRFIAKGSDYVKAVS